MPHKKKKNSSKSTDSGSTKTTASGAFISLALRTACLKEWERLNQTGSSQVTQMRFTIRISPEPQQKALLVQVQSDTISQSLIFGTTKRTIDTTYRFGTLGISRIGQTSASPLNEKTFTADLPHRQSTGSAVTPPTS